MKINYELSFVNIKSFSEFYSISSLYPNIKKTGKIKNTNLLFSQTICFILLTLLSIINLYIFFSDWKINEDYFIIGFVCSLVAIVYLFALILAFNLYSASKKEQSSKNNTLIIDKNGITDKTENMSITVNWDKIEHVIIGKNCIVIFFGCSINLHFPIEIRKDLLDGISKYNSNKNIKIIEKY